jgi:tryptophan halogenase
MRILIYGSGLSAETTAIALSKSVGPPIEIIRAGVDESSPEDILYGGHAPPSSIEFFRQFDILEPTLCMGSDTAFSFGTRYDQWPVGLGQWVQSFQQPIPPLNGVPLHHYVYARGEDIESYLIAAQAILSGVFAHPPEDPNNPLERAEYGYSFTPESLTRLLSKHPVHNSIAKLNGGLQAIDVTDGKIGRIRLETGDIVEADLFLDCSGPSRALMSALDADFNEEADLAAETIYEPSPTLGLPCQTVSGQQNGWSSRTYVQGHLNTLKVTKSAQGQNQSGTDAIHFNSGHLSEAWVGNCVALGHAAYVLEPLTPAPMHLLQLNIERLLQLIPHTSEMRVERKEFNRLYKNDYEHAAMFHHSLFVADTLPEGAYWQDKAKQPISPGLERKLTQFKSRGLVVQFDYEPFNEEDWMVQHFGLGRRPSRNDIHTANAAKIEIEQILTAQKRDIAKTIAGMPPHHIYLSKFKDYLLRTQNARG